MTLLSSEAFISYSFFPLSIIMVGVGDGPWDTMKHFDDCIPERRFDNFQVSSVVEHYTGVSLNVMYEIIY